MMSVYTKEKMSGLVKWVFTLPLTYIIYYAFSLLIPQAGTVSLILRYAVMIGIFLFLSTRFLSFDWHRYLRCNYPQSRFSWKKLFAGMALMFFILSALSFIRMLIYPAAFSVTFDVTKAADTIAPVILVAVAALSEELMFRGFVAFFAGREAVQSILCCLSSGLLFALAHFQNPEVSEMGIMSMLFYFVFGALLMFIYLKDGGIEFALGIHIGNNLVPALLVTYPGAVISTNAVFTAPQSLIEDFIACAVVFVIFFISGRKAHSQECI